VSRTLTVYSRPDCHLCDEMLDALSPLVRGRASVEIVDISDDDELEVRYGLRIPVLCAGNEELCCYRLDADCVRQWLASAA
jgi:hypothetical protein